MTRILVVDDEPDVAEYLAETLELNDWQTGIAYNGVDGVLKVLDGGWNAVVMDVRMPKLDGINALKIMKRVAPDLPVVIFTGQAGQGDMFEATQSGAFTCLMKPVSIEKLLSVLEQALANLDEDSMPILDSSVSIM
jgi:two-component system response regulator CpxR